MSQTRVQLVGNVGTGASFAGIVTATSFSGDGSGLTGVGLGTEGSINTSGIITATAFYGDGSNLTGIVTDNFYVTGGTYNSNTLTLDRNDGNSVVVTGFTSGGGDNFYVTGGTVSGTDLILYRNGGLSDITIDTSPYFDNTDRFVTGATMNGNILEL